MKKLILLLIGFAVFSCGSSKQVVAKKEITGKWSMESITDSNGVKLTNDLSLLNDVSLVCFHESLWKFDPSTNSGEYNINDLYCSFGKRKFLYNSQEINKLNGYYDFTIIPTLKKGKKVPEKSFKFKLVNLSQTTMQWQYNVILNKKITTLKINFKKLNQPNVTAI